MVDHRCWNCRQTATVNAVPEDGLCGLCWIISEADPRDRERIAGVFRRPVPAAGLPAEAPAARFLTEKNAVKRAASPAAPPATNCFIYDCGLRIAMHLERKDVGSLHRAGRPSLLELRPAHHRRRSPGRRRTLCPLWGHPRDGSERSRTHRRRFQETHSAAGIPERGGMAAEVSSARSRRPGLGRHLFEQRKNGLQGNPGRILRGKPVLDRWTMLDRI